MIKISKIISSPVLHLILFAVLVPLLLSMGCATEKKQSYDEFYKDYKQRERKYAAEVGFKKPERGFEFPEYVCAFSPLTLDKFNDIKSDTEVIYTISLSYHEFYNFDENGNPLQAKILDVDGGIAGNASNFSEIDKYYIVFSKLNDRSLEEENREDDAECDAAGVVEVMNYLGAPGNREYFFNGEEYSGLQLPYMSDTGYINSDNYVFVLNFTDINDVNHCWVISKCIVEPNEIWQGLIDILEENFISQFE
jgi:hypothetical protein